jgi:exodeoxyribonuclease V alpha subunit
METLEASVTDIKFSSNNGFHVLVCTGPDKKTQRVVVTFPGLTVSKGMKIRFKGKTETHATYGLQFTAMSAEVIPEKGKMGVVSYLSGYVKSIGPITASRLYDLFGDSLLDILNKNPELIRDAPFLSEKQAEAIINEWRTASASRNTSIFLSDLGLTSSQIKQVLTEFGGEAKSKIQENPYCLMEVSGIGFSTADKVGRALNCGVDDIRRVDAIFLGALQDLCFNDGNTYAIPKQIQDYISGKFFKRNKVEAFSHGDFISDSQYYGSFKRLKTLGSISVDDSDRIYIPSLHLAEYGVANRLAESLAQSPYGFPNIEESISEYQKNNNITFSDDQLSAFRQLESSRVLAVTGFPGTGKTTLISAFVHLFESNKLTYSLLSPTGIAAKRLSQVTGRPASTIHRALGYKSDDSWEFHSGNKYHVDAVIVDEMSMVDIQTMFRLVDCLDKKTILVFVGDSAQLPSVGPGHVLNNLIESRKFPSVSLSRIYRQGKTSDIILTAHNILNGHGVDVAFKPDSEFCVLPMNQDEVVSEVTKLSTKLKQLNKNFQVISPMYDGDLGVNNMNSELRSFLNPDAIIKKSPHVKSGTTDLYEGDRVMIIKNDYERGVYNGDTGKITRIDIKADTVEVKVFDWFDPTSNVQKYVDKIITYKVEEARSNLKVAYACTAHKVQGQEFDYVIMPMTMSYGIMLYKNLVYTAITRAKKKVFIMGDKNAFLAAVSNTRETQRNSNLASLIDSGADLMQIKVVQDS